MKKIFFTCMALLSAILLTVACSIEETETPVVEAVSEITTRSGSIYDFDFYLGSAFLENNVAYMEWKPVDLEGPGAGFKLLKSVNYGTFFVVAKFDNLGQCWYRDYDVDSANNYRYQVQVGHWISLGNDYFYGFAGLKSSRILELGAPWSGSGGGGGGGGEITKPPFIEP